MTFGNIILIKKWNKGNNAAQHTDKYPRTWEPSFKRAIEREEARHLNTPSSIPYYSMWDLGTS
jgi:hypothetical protein